MLNEIGTKKQSAYDGAVVFRIKHQENEIICQTWNGTQCTRMCVVYCLYLKPV